MKKTAMWIAYLALATCAAPGASGPAASGGAGGGRTTSSGGDAGQPTGPEGTLTSSAGQIVVVIASDWTSVPATLTRYQATAHGVWAQVGSSFPVVLGNAGLG